MSDSEYDPDYQPSSHEPSDSLSSDSGENSEESLSNQRQFQRSTKPSGSHTLSESSWSIPTDGPRKKQFSFTAIPGIKNISPNCQNEFDFWSLLVDEEIIHMMVTMTNSYANKKNIIHHVTRNSRLAKWKNCDPAEIKKILGLLLWMGLKKLPKISDYWSKDIPII
ncbi:unnamed protein product [Parnassius mnemosyne]|uniref:PiggyBac transposable element-derived protein domain-containing protein n=1 Tax=Parnassius mnemosyne TaxID=213953 RepID=A0AAV1L7S4_9NEOP